jgi:hypothetical protein
MKIVDARLSTGEVVLIKEEWFIKQVENRSDWRAVDPVWAEAGPMKMKVNPKFIVWLRILDFDS